MQKALEYNPKDGYAHYVLGRWCFQVASVGWIQRKAAAALFASPPESSYEQALEHFKMAETRQCFTNPSFHSRSDRTFQSDATFEHRTRASSKLFSESGHFQRLFSDGSQVFPADGRQGKGGRVLEEVRRQTRQGPRIVEEHRRGQCPREETQDLLVRPV